MKSGQALLFITAVLVSICMLLPGCGGPSAEALEEVDYTPVPGLDWQVSTPEAEGIDPLVVAEAYYTAGEIDTIFSLLVVKNGKLIAEKYFNDGAIDELNKRASVTKSYVSAMCGIAIDHGWIKNVDQKMLAYYPEVTGKEIDPRKEEITIQDMLEMRSGYPSEEHHDQAWEIMWTGDYMDAVADLPLTADPGTKMQYSNLTAHWLGVIVARASGMDLRTLGKEYLFDPIGSGDGEGWITDVDGYYIGGGDIMMTSRDMAKFGQLYLDDGMFCGQRVISADWVADSLKTYTVNEFEVSSVGKFKNMGYGYFWWSAEVGDYRVNFAWGHGGQLIVLVDDLDLVVVTTADAFWGQDTHFDAWKYESAIMKMVSELVYNLRQE